MSLQLRFNHMIFLVSLCLVACGAVKFKSITPEVSAKNVVTNVDSRIDTVIGDDKVRIRVLGQASQLLDHSSLSATSLTVGLQRDIFATEQILGATIIAVSDHTSSVIGGLKLTSVEPLHGSFKVIKDGADDVAVFSACMENCSELSAKTEILRLPVQGYSDSNQTVLLDFTGAGSQLRISQLASAHLGDSVGQGRVTSSTVTRVDYSDRTIVIDTDELVSFTDHPDVHLTVRWYIRLSSDQTPYFASRPNTDGIGYFTTKRNGDKTWIRRWSLADADADHGSIHYFIKNVPAQWQPAFTASFDGWNQTFKDETGRKLVEYTVLAADDPRNTLITTGDIRYNVLEWDLVDKASYGGLGPSVSLETSGQMLSANTLIQGPTIETMYKAWFKVQDQVRNLVDSGQDIAAQKLVRDATLDAQAKSPGKLSAEITLGPVKLAVPAGRTDLEDPAAPRTDFFFLPDGETFDSYMQGYFRDMVSHELGHNMGLRHNFRGNLNGSGPDHPSA